MRARWGKRGGKFRESYLNEKKNERRHVGKEKLLFTRSIDGTERKGVCVSGGGKQARSRF